MLVAFFVPAAVEEYAKQAAVLEPTNLSLEALTADGVRVRVQADFQLDGSRVREENTRRIGRVATWLVGSLTTEETRVAVYLPEYDNILLGTAALPPLTVHIADGYTTSIDMVAELAPGDTDGIRSAGVIPLGTHSLAESLSVEANQLPTLPAYNISQLSFYDIPGTNRAVGANVTITSYNKYPVDLVVPELGFDVLVPNCDETEPLIPVAVAISEPVPVHAKSAVEVTIHSAVERLPDDLVRTCPGTGSSPLDDFVRRYLDGKPADVVVRGRKLPSSSTPAWVGEILSSIAVPLPDPLADPDDEDSDPTVSGTIRVVVALPKELNVDIDVSNLKATADVFYKKRPFGTLKIEDWQRANSTKLNDPASGETTLEVNSRVEDVPLHITDSAVFTQVMQALIFGNRDVMLDVKALVDIKVDTALGELVLNKVPTKGNIPGLDRWTPTYGQRGQGAEDDQVGDTHRGAGQRDEPDAVLCHGPLLYDLRDEEWLGHWRRNHSRRPDRAGQERELARVCSYISGHNITIAAKAHRGSIPAAPAIGEALSGLDIEVSAPHLNLPSDDPDDKGRFIRDATFHVFSSTATFTLVSPFEYNTLLLEWVNATAYYNHTEPVGRIEYDEAFAVPPG
ncbi:unnamed protein product [Parascedosporium putredinis]|uniref:Uncharacterized protein n=1 Tax=Parascedosporium putredinis TaxID=1442378 RepID=A0A9P1GW28_9PEZI|nr:unnamed protein product [Parascedosporium putredinis]CAI7989067.1 unnamed protein product [Parascedosporium putredinis]